MITKVWAHRGASAYAPENTLEAYELAAKQKADGIELDIQLTKDGELVVIHDETVNRVSDHKGPVADYTLKDLKKINVNKKFLKYKKAAVPTLEEVYQLVKPTELTVNVELKTSVNFYPGIEEKALEVAAKCGMEDRVIYSSFNHYSLLRLKKLSKEAKTGILISDIIVDAPDYAANLGFDAIHPSLNILQVPDFVQNCRENNIAIHPWTVNEEIHMKMMLESGVNAIITNKPDVCRKLVESFYRFGN
jgi:glycerophosphoryl diester phosphodiesterase